MRQRRHGIGVARVFGVLFPGLGVGFADDDGGHGVDLDVLAPAAGVLDLFAQRGDDVTHRRLRAGQEHAFGVRGGEALAPAGGAGLI